jgi:predicted ATPase
MKDCFIATPSSPRGRGARIFTFRKSDCEIVLFPAEFEFGGAVNGRFRDMKTTVVLEVSASNFLSFREIKVTLNPLSVLVGPNGAGKTNFLRIFQFLGDVARSDLVPAIDRLGGIGQIQFRNETPAPTVTLSLHGVITENASIKAQDEYSLSFRERRFRSARLEHVRRLVDREETILIKRTKGRGRRITLSGHKFQIAPFGESSKPAKTNEERSLSVQSESSGLNTIRKLGDEYGAHQVEALAQAFESMRLFDVNVDKVRTPARTVSSSYLEDDAGNLAAYLHWLSEEHKAIFDRVCEDISFVLPSFEEFRFTKIGGADEGVRLDFKERHLTGHTPLARASFGTIRAIALFAMLNDPNPPRLTCLEEVDHGLHPHALDRLVDRLREAAERTQIIVATHSPALVNRIKEDEIIIFERDPETGATRIVDLSPEEISRMKKVSGFELGELWFSGSLGGTHV